MMKKYIALTALTLTLAGGILAGCGSGKDIGQDAAKEAAFADAQVSEGDTTRLRVTKDRDDGRQIYEVEFTAGNREYSYDIDASDGSILSTETEELQGSTGNSQGSASNNTTGNRANAASGTEQGASQDSSAQQTQDASQNAGSQDAQNGQSTQNTQTQNNQTGQNSGANVAVSEADARAAALARVSGATDTDIKIELDFDDGQYIYEGDIIYDGKEYEFEIDANTGNFLKWSEERW